MRPFICALAILAPGAAAAHSGHIAATAGHDHLLGWIVVPAVLAAVFYGVLTARPRAVADAAAAAPSA